MSNVTFIFDDGYQAEYDLAFPLFKEHNVKACSAITSGFIGHKKIGTGEPYVTKEQLLEMQQYGWEILSHGKTHAELAKLSLHDAEQELKGSKYDLLQMGLNVDGFVYPCHNSNQMVRQSTSQYYKYARGQHGRDITNKYNLSGIMIDDHTQLEVYKFYIDQCKEDNTWLIFYCHMCTSKFIASTVQDRFNTLVNLLQYCHKKNVVIATAKEVYESSNSLK